MTLLARRQATQSAKLGDLNVGPALRRFLSTQPTVLVLGKREYFRQILVGYIATSFCENTPYYVKNKREYIFFSYVVYKTTFTSSM